MVDPSNKNFLGQVGFQFILDRLPTVNFFTQTVGLPGISFGGPIVETPIKSYPLPGEKLTFGPFSITFRVDEDLKNYLELYNWLIGLGSPVTTEQRRLYSINNSFMSDATLMILSSKYNPNVSVRFRGMFPESISELQFTTNTTDIEYLEATATFRYTDYVITSS